MPEVKELYLFTLEMEDPVVEGLGRIDHVTISWAEYWTRGEVLQLSGEWITTKNFLTQRMQGLERVGESSLTIEPIEPAD